ncbi:SpoIIE family protein phosphatase/ATP-binding protein [Streptomyces lydicus]|uniref:SpoIIE family protein phosphatase/ATP-binding protein n=1 Tax=Streptomyces lydicus TaxID=47763 RepID=UPI0005264DB0|nr:SpoIIE family protein phosphatase/ATP-binding protein [Streptomyces lydicus]MDC7335475.1 SpoIIE family protein phosphatase [Streptomyces lydicus]UEG89096.1 SpoIIE family protein phosphatase [Streptomyces lydicus]
MAGRYGRPRSVLRMRTVAGQVFLLQVAIVVVLVAAAMAALVLQSRSDSEREARHRSLAVAQSFANAPGMQAALQSPDPTAVLQPRAEAARKSTGVDFIVVMNTQGIRYTHPMKNRIGKKFVGTLQPALSGGVVTEKIVGTIGPLVQAVVPVFGSDGKVIGLVSAGITIKKVSGVVDDQFPLLFGAAAGVLVLALGGTALVGRRLRRQTHGLGPAEMTRMYEHHDAVLHAVREGVIIVGGDGRVLLANDEARRLLDLPADVEGRQATELGLDPATAQLLASGRAVTDEVHPVGERLLAVNQRSTDEAGGPPGSVTTLRDTTELRALTGRADVARGRLKLLYDAGTEIGTTLDVVRTCEELAEFASSRFADIVTVDLVEDVLTGEEPSRVTGTDITMRRTAVSGAPPDTGLYPVGELIRFDLSTSLGAGLTSGEPVLEPDLAAFRGWHLQHPQRARKIVSRGIHSMIAVPLRARGAILGVVLFWRSQNPQPFEEEDLSLAEELVARAAVSLDNARRYTREHNMAVTLQRSLLPRGLPEQNAVEAAYRYLPAQAGRGGLGGVGGDWFDIIPLPGARVALVVGDVVGHGLHAAATMGRLRTAVHNFANLDLPPDEILWHLDELVTRIDQDEGAEGAEAPVTGATCLYAIYDPATGTCTMARAGHVQPLVVRPDGTAELADVPGGPPLGLGGLPFETWQQPLPEDSRLVLFTDGLVEDRDRDIDEGLALLTRTLSGHAEQSPEEICEAALGALLPERPSDDIALLVARTRVLDAAHVADWDVPPDPSAVAQVRAAAVRKLIEWGLADEAFTTELILSELVTNSIRYASGPIRVRLIRDTALICEVSDRSSTSPHLRQAATTDEGGRGLFLIAQLAERWGTRYTSGGKVIWTEQTLPDRDVVAGGADVEDA